MLDSLVINIPLDEIYCRHLDGSQFSIALPIEHYQVRTTGEIYIDVETSQIGYRDLKHPFESLPSSYGSGVAMKFYDKTTNCLPYVSLNSSPKILQGHNVCFTDSIQELAFEMMYLLKESYPIFFNMLNLQETSIARLDVNYGCRLPYADNLEPVIAMLGNVSNGKRKPDAKRNTHKSTRYWNSSKNRIGYCKVYSKNDEFASQLKTWQRSADRGSLASKHLLEKIDDKLIEYSKNLLRFEATCKKEQLNQLDMPTNLWQFIDYQNSNKDALLTLWHKWFDPILNALKGEILTEYDDAQIYELCQKRLVCLTKSGKVSYTKANNAYNFYILLKAKGYEHVRQSTSKTAFCRSVKSLTQIGIPKSFLQNLKGHVQTVPLVELIVFDFTKQAPDNYTPPVSQYRGFEKYLLSKTTQPVLYS